MKMGLSQREKRVLASAAVVIVLLVAYLVVESTLTRYAALADKIEVEKQELIKIAHLRQQYLQTQQQLSQIQAQLDRMESGFSVLSFIEDLANKQQIRENIGSVKPNKVPLGESYEERKVEVELDAITLPKLVDFVYKIENAGHLLKVERMRIKARYDNPDLLNVTLQVTTIAKKKA